MSALPRRVAVVVLPDLARALAARARGGALEECVVVIRPASPTWKLRAVQRIAAASVDLQSIGVRAPMRVLDAQRLVPALDVVVVNEAEIEHEVLALAELLLSFSPIVEPRPDTIRVELTGLAERDQVLATTMAHAVTACGHAVSVGVAPGPRLAEGVARAAWAFRRTPAPPPVVVTSPQAPDVVRRLPLSMLSLSPELLESLDAMGLETVGDIERLRAHRVDERLAAETGPLQSLLAGHDDEPLRAFACAERIVERLELEHGIVDVEPLLFVLRPLLERLLRRLAVRGERLTALDALLTTRPITTSLDADLPFGTPSRVTLNLTFPSPIDDVGALVRAFALRLESLGVEGEIVAIELTVVRGTRVVARQILFDFVDAPPRIEDDRALSALLAELVAELGPERVGQLCARPGLLPEELSAREILLEPGAPPSPVTPLGPGRFSHRWPWPVRLLALPHPLPAERVERIEPFLLLDGRSPADDDVARRYFLAALDDGRRALAVEDPESEELLVHGWFD